MVCPIPQGDHKNPMLEVVEPMVMVDSWYTDVGLRLSSDR